MLQRAVRSFWAVAAALSLAHPASAATAGAGPGNPQATISHGRFEQIPVLMPAGEPQRVVIWLAGAGSRARQYAEALRRDGAMVAVVDVARLYRVLAKQGGKCGFSVGDVENFSRYLQAYEHVPTYRLPLLAGDGDGAALAYALAAQAPAHVLAGVVSDGLCPQTVASAALCGPAIADGSRTLQPAALPVPLLVAAGAGLQCPGASELLGKVAQARSFKRDGHAELLPGLRAAVRSLGAQKGVSLPPPPADLDGLPVVEVPGTTGTGDTFAIFVSGDGGWAGLDKQVAGALAQAGIPVVGVDSLRYFWTQRNPAGFAADLQRIADFYAQRWQRSRIVLIGFSQGADVLPAAINQLPAATRAQVRMTALLSLGKLADYEFHLSNWVEDDDDGLPIAPQLQRLPAARTVCIYGRDDEDALCRSLKNAPRPQVLPGDHHFDGDYQALAKTILQQLQATPD